MVLYPAISQNFNYYKNYWKLAASIEEKPTKILGCCKYHRMFYWTTVPRQGQKIVSKFCIHNEYPKELGM